MPPRRQNQRNLQELEIEELRQQIQRLQGIVEAQQAQLDQHRTTTSDHGKTCLCHTCSNTEHVLLSNTYVEETVREFLAEYADLC